MILSNMVWPALYVMGYVNIWWVVGISLLIEGLCLLFLIQERIWKIGLMAVSMNLISALVGIIGIPIVGLIWEVVALFTIYQFFEWGTFNPVSWIVSYILAALLNSVIEMMSLIFIFKMRWKAKIFWWLVFANGITVSIAYRVMQFNPPRFL